MVYLGEDVPMSSDYYLDKCRLQLTGRQFDKIKPVSLVPDGTPRTETENVWQEWETFFRNALVRQRAAAGNQKPEQWLHYEADVFPGLQTQIEEAFAADNPAARQFALDKLRWSKLDEMSVSHPYDFGALVIYRLRLLLAEEWAAKDTEEGYSKLEDILGNIEEQAVNVRGNVQTEKA